MSPTCPQDPNSAINLSLWPRARNREEMAKILHGTNQLHLPLIPEFCPQYTYPGGWLEYDFRAISAHLYWDLD